MREVDRIRLAFEGHGLQRWAAQLDTQWHDIEQERRHGDMDRWESLLAQLPAIEPTEVDLASDTVRVTGVLTDAERCSIETLLKRLKPWRKGPFDIHGVFVDTEWRSNWKWQRLAPHIQPLAGRRVLDVGCGNGYHAWRMAGEGAALVVAIDPTQLFWAQFLAIRHFLGPDWPVHFLPLGIEDVPKDLAAFDSVFSMGVLYHRRSPIDHLLELKACLRPGGELVLETLVIEGGEGQTLLPAGRYAKMRNVWFIPSALTLKSWLERCAFTQVHIADVSTTTTDEQRATDWMSFESLADFLDPQDPSKTVEGYPAPRRAILTARA